MAKFATPANTNQELAGSMTEFKDELIALQARGGTITVKTSYGPTEALRVQVVDPLTGDDHGIRLLFWTPVQAALTAVHAAGDDWLVGVLKQQPQKDDPTKTFYSMIEPDFDIDWTEVEANIDSFEAAVAAQTHPGQTPQAPF